MRSSVGRGGKHIDTFESRIPPSPPLPLKGGGSRKTVRV
jgi:hypothetical protein